MQKLGILKDYNKLLKLRKKYSDLETINIKNILIGWVALGSLISLPLMHIWNSDSPLIFVLSMVLSAAGMFYVIVSLIIVWSFLEGGMVSKGDSKREIIKDIENMKLLEVNKESIHVNLETKKDLYSKFDFGTLHKMIKEVIGIIEKDFFTSKEFLTKIGIEINNLEDRESYKEECLLFISLVNKFNEKVDKENEHNHKVNEALEALNVMPTKKDRNFLKITMEKEL